MFGLWGEGKELKRLKKRFARLRMEAKSAERLIRVSHCKSRWKEGYADGILKALQIMEGNYDD